MCLHVGKRNKSQKGFFFSLERVNKLQMENSFTENKQINENETFLLFAVS